MDAETTVRLCDRVGHMFENVFVKGRYEQGDTCLRCGHRERRTTPRLPDPAPDQMRFDTPADASDLIY